MNCVFFLHGSWQAMYEGKLAQADWNCRGAAQAWLDRCVRDGRWYA